MEEQLKDYEEEIKLQAKLTVKMIEVLWEELQKSKLPDEFKKSILLNYGNKESK